MSVPEFGMELDSTQDDERDVKMWQGIASGFQMMADAIRERYPEREAEPEPVANLFIRRQPRT